MAKKKKKNAYDAEKKQALQFFRKNDLAKASSIYSKIRKKKPNDFDACFMLGVIAQKMGNLEQAVNRFIRATEIKKNSAKAFYQLGITLRELQHINAAINALTKAIEIKADYLEAYDVLTGILQAEGLHHELITICNNVISLMPDEVEFHARLAGAYEVTSQLQQAKVAAEVAIKLNPLHTRALFTLAKVTRRNGELEAARDQLKSLLGMQLLPAQFSAVAGELGEVLDRLEDYDSAFKIFERANQAMQGTVSPQSLQQNPAINNIRNLQSFFTDGIASKWASQEPDDGLESPLFLVGFPRSGTTLAEQILTSSGEVKPSDEQMIIPRLISEFSELLDRPMSYPKSLSDFSEADLSILRKRYWGLVSEMCGEVKEGKYFLDKLPLNIVEIGFIYRIFPNANVLVMLRDPRDCCLSGFMRQFVLNDSMINLTDVAQTGKFYASVMELWFQYRKNIPVKYKQFRYEDLVADQEGTSRALLEFLGLEWNEAVLRYFEKVKERNVRTPSYSAVSTPIYKRAVGRWKNYEKQLMPMMGSLLPYIKEFGYD